MWFSVTVVYIVLSKCSSLAWQVPEKGGSSAAQNLQDMAYKSLSPEAFFSMKDNLPNPVPPVVPIGPDRPMKPGSRPGEPMRPGMGPMRPGMGPMRPGMGPMPPGMGPVRPGMGPMRPGMGPMPPGMGPMRPGMGPMRPGMGPMPPGMGPMAPGMESKKPGSRPGKPMAPDMGLTDAPQPVVMRGYEHFELSTLDDMSRESQQYGENYAEEVVFNVKNDELIIYNLCFAISYIWRRGRESIRKYFHLRDIYHNHLPFEVGYITHVIMSKYQTMLELYEFSASLAAMKENTITELHMAVLLKTTTEDGLTIEQLCNMLHELKNKYSFQEYDPANKFDIPPPDYYDQTTTEADDTTTSGRKLRVGKDQPKLDKGYIGKRIKESHKVIDEALGKRKKKLQDSRDFYKKYGYFPSTTRVPQQPMRLWSPNLDYGWSGEDEW